MRRYRHRTLNRKKIERFFKCRTFLVAINRKTRITKPLVDQVGIHQIPVCNLCDRNARHPRLSADRPLLLIQPNPLLPAFPARHRIPQAVHYQWWTLSDTPSHRQSGEIGRIRLIDPISLLSFPGIYHRVFVVRMRLPKCLRVGLNWNICAASRITFNEISTFFEQTSSLHHDAKAQTVDQRIAFELN